MHLYKHGREKETVASWQGAKRTAFRTRDVNATKAPATRPIRRVKSTCQALLQFRRFCPSHGSQKLKLLRHCAS